LDKSCASQRRVKFAVKSGGLSPIWWVQTGGRPEQWPTNPCRRRGAPSATHQIVSHRTTASRSKIQDEDEEEEDDYVPNPNSEKADEMSAGHAPLSLFQGGTASVPSHSLQLFFRLAVIVNEMDVRRVIPNSYRR